MVLHMYVWWDLLLYNKNTEVRLPLCFVVIYQLNFSNLFSKGMYFWFVQSQAGFFMQD